MQVSKVGWERIRDREEVFVVHKMTEQVTCSRYKNYCILVNVTPEFTYIK